MTDSERAKLILGRMDAIRLKEYKERRLADDLKESDYLILSILFHKGATIVGDLTRSLGMLPAQTSRALRRLEFRNPALIECNIDGKDKRKVQVCLTPVGHGYMGGRTARIAARMTVLPPNVQDEVVAALDVVDTIICPPAS